MNVRIPSPLRSYTGGNSQTLAEGETLGEVLADLDRKYPGIRFRIIDEQDRIRQHIKFFVNTEPADSLQRSIGQSDTLHIICALSGG
ncbi:MAG: MoaD/ThiS family protein [Cyanobacteria bacterium SZAS LIN-3]|nr:MoaD/ThiS family protein [Cyanobacteria bacterium SZAS LIN-3]